MSKLNVGVGEEFPLGDNPQRSGERQICAQHWRHHRHRNSARAVAALLVLPATAASVTAAIVYPLATLGVIGGLGIAAAVQRRRRWRAYRDACRARRDASNEAKGKSSDSPPASPEEKI